jgi:hypothetical protein
MILPVITVKAERYHVETKKAEIKVNAPAAIRISNLVTSFEFIQTEPVSDEIKQENFKIYLIDNEGKPISDIQEHRANSTETDPRKRISRYTFRLVNKKYTRTDAFYLLIRTDEYELSRTPVTIDIPFADNFGFFAGDL